jgi:hypothetical protein
MMDGRDKKWQWFESDGCALDGMLAKGFLRCALRGVRLPRNEFNKAQERSPVRPAAQTIN